jgi:glyoxylase-like metal-dependent hydrolase (beta-lactamase superfamily II)
VTGPQVHIFEHLVVGPLGCNCYIAGDIEAREAIVIDPGGDIEVITQAVARHGLSVTAIVATHAHFDHVLAAEALRVSTGAPFYLHPADRPVLEWLQESGRLFLGVELPPPPQIDADADEDERLKAGGIALQVIHTPGHSPGSISLVAPDMIFSGDTLFAGSVGRTDLPGGDAALLVDAVKTKLFNFADESPVYPGHGPATTIGAEKETNPFVGVRGAL